MTIQFYYELLKEKEVETGSGYGKYLTNRETTIKKSMNLENLIELLESKYKGDKKEWILLPKHLLKENPFNYEEEDYCIVKTKLEESEIIEGIEYKETDKK